MVRGAFRWDLFRKHIAEYMKNQGLNYTDMQFESGVSKHHISAFLKKPDKRVTVESMACLCLAADLDFYDYAVPRKDMPN